MPTDPASPRSISFPGIHKDVRETWITIIEDNLSDLNNTDNTTELWDNLDRLAIPGIGYESKRRVAEWILRYNENIVIEDNSYICLLTQKVQKILKKQNITDSEGLWEWIAENYPSISEKKELEKISYLNTHLNNKL